MDGGGVAVLLPAGLEGERRVVHPRLARHGAVLLGDARVALLGGGVGGRVQHRGRDVVVGAADRTGDRTPVRAERTGTAAGLHDRRVLTLTLMLGPRASALLPRCDGHLRAGENIHATFTALDSL